MRFVGGFLAVALACMTGCGGTVILASGNRPPARVPAPAPCVDCARVDRDEAARIVRNAALRHDIARLRIHEIERKAHDWRVEGRGIDNCGHRVEVRARVDRRSGDVTKFQLKSAAHRHRGRHDDD